MRKIMRKLLITLGALLLLLLIPLSASAQKADPLDAYVDTDMLYDYIQYHFDNQLMTIPLTEFDIPASAAMDVDNFIRFRFPESLLFSAEPQVHTANGYVNSARIYLYDETRVATIRKAADDLLAGIEGNEQLTDLQKVLLVHDRLVLWTEYDYDGLMNNTLPPEAYTEYGALVNRLCVCNGYALAYRYLLARVGVRSDVHSSEAMNHAWNGVHLDGKIHMVDATWDDGGGKHIQGLSHRPVKHDYFLKGDNRYQLIDATDNYHEPYASTYSSVQWPDVSYWVNGQMYGSLDDDLVKFNGTQMTKVTLPDKDYFLVYEPALPVGNKLIGPGFDFLRALDVNTGEDPIIWNASARIDDMAYHDGKIACLVNGMWVYPFADTTHTVTFYDYDGKILKTSSYQYGQVVTPPVEPVRAGYHFTGWNKQVEVCSGNAVYTATYTPYASADSWIKKNDRWYYIHNDRYYTGWLQQGNNWYYLNYAGKMETGFYTLKTYVNTIQIQKTYYYFDQNGVMQTGWKKVDGSWYYFKPVAGNATIGWSQIGGKWYFFTADGKMKTGLFHENGKTYWLTDSGMHTGWLRSTGTNGVVWYYYGSDGNQVEGWKQIDGQWYFFNNYGEMQTGWIKYQNAWYYLNKDGAMQTGWIQHLNKWYYLNKHGIMQTGWIQLGKSWYYLNQDGVMQTGWIYYMNESYYLKQDGIMQTGWVKIQEDWYYFGANGAMQTGWQKIGGNWYYLWGSDGMVTNFREIGGKRYYFGDNGAMRIGWIPVPTKVYKLDGTVETQTSWYYANSSGVIHVGWLKLGNNWYYMESFGAMATGRRKIDNKWYTFGSDGILIS